MLSEGEGSLPDNKLLLKSTDIKLSKSHSFVEIVPRKWQSLMLRIRNDPFIGSMASNKSLKFIVSPLLPARISTSNDCDLNLVPSSKDDN